MTDEMNTVSNPEDEPADETTPRDSAPVIANFQGPDDPEAEQLLRTLVAAGSSNHER
jgi:hypothetical protein